MAEINYTSGIDPNLEIDPMVVPILAVTVEQVVDLAGSILSEAARQEGQTPLKVTKEMTYALRKLLNKELGIGLPETAANVASEITQKRPELIS